MEDLLGRPLPQVPDLEAASATAGPCARPPHATSYAPLFPLRPDALDRAAGKQNSRAKGADSGDGDRLIPALAVTLRLRASRSGRPAFETDGLIGDLATAANLLEFRGNTQGQTRMVAELVERDPSKPTGPPAKRLECQFEMGECEPAAGLQQKKAPSRTPL